ncbi:MAG: hypothetical protein A2284_08760 [Deltaproteobacteria bacterium RIFOXYA12_FULL_61_11]|nr:MAG: hypothetical protein A2284_08760 [Deltaproteobacteria bacterium RIFOXYA12_FULL_61_11]
MDLYYFPACPYCRRVLRFLEGEGSVLLQRVVLRDILAEPDQREVLLRLNHGEDQVPCLVVDGVPMLESLDIIEYLRSLL